MRSVTQQTMYLVDDKSFDSFTKAKGYALERDLTEIVGLKLGSNATIKKTVEFLFENANDIKSILSDYCIFFQGEKQTSDPEEPKIDPSEDPASPSPAEG